MNKIYPKSTAKTVLMAPNSPNLNLFIGIFSLRLQIWVTTLQNLYLYLIRPVILHLFFCKNSTVPTPDCCSTEKGLMSGEVEMVMDKLGFDCNPRGDELEERIIRNLFDENEPSLEELKEAFDVFDKNRDGYIDAKELEEVICRLGNTDFAERDCQRMIAAFDDNGDGFVDLNDFLNLVYNSF